MIATFVFILLLGVLVINGILVAVKQKNEMPQYVNKLAKITIGLFSFSLVVLLVLFVVFLIMVVTGRSVFLPLTVAAGFSSFVLVYTIAIVLRMIDLANEAETLRENFKILICKVKSRLNTW